jgi:4-nitrophenyl phosphatase
MARMRAMTRRAKGFVFDLDGTLVLHDRKTRDYHLLPGAAETIRHLRAKDIPFIVFTNGTARTPANQACALRKAGLDIADRQLVTPSSVAADFYVAQGIREVLVVGAEGATGPLADAGLRIVSTSDPGSQVEALYVGWAASFTSADLDCVCHHVWQGIPFHVSTNARFFASLGGRATNIAGAIAAGVEYVTQRPAEVIGKPSRRAIEFASRRLGLPIEDIAVVGDDPDLDIGMARRNGAWAIAVETGVADHDAWRAQSEDSRPDVLIPDLRALLPLLT